MRSCGAGPDRPARLRRVLCPNAPGTDKAGAPACDVRAVGAPLRFLGIRVVGTGLASHFGRAIPATLRRDEFPIPARRRPPSRQPVSRALRKRTTMSLPASPRRAATLSRTSSLRRWRRVSRFAVIAGDVFDGDWRDASIGLFFNRQLARLTNRGVPTYLPTRQSRRRQRRDQVADLARQGRRVLDQAAGDPPHRGPPRRAARARLSAPRRHRELRRRLSRSHGGLVQYRRSAYRLRSRGPRELRALHGRRSRAREATTTGRSATSTPSRSSRAIPGSSIPAIFRAAASGNAARKGR